MNLLFSATAVITQTSNQRCRIFILLRTYTVDSLVLSLSHSNAHYFSNELRLLLLQQSDDFYRSSSDHLFCYRIKYKIFELNDNNLTRNFKI